MTEYYRKEAAKMKPAKSISPKVQQKIKNFNKLYKNVHPNLKDYINIFYTKLDKLEDFTVGKSSELILYYPKDIKQVLDFDRTSYDGKGIDAKVYRKGKLVNKFKVTNFVLQLGFTMMVTYVLKETVFKPTYGSMLTNDFNNFLNGLKL